MRRIRIAPLGRAGRRSIAIPCDLLAVSGGWNPILHLYAQAQGRLHYDEALTAFVPGELTMWRDVKELRVQSNYLKNSEE